jgi:hypothetical protein
MTKKVKFDKKGVKVRDENILCIILKEGKGSKWQWVNENDDKFTVDENTYFIINSGTYIWGRLRFLIYLEGISTPIHHGYIERERILKKYKDRDTGTEKSLWISRIKGLKFDSKIINMLLNRNLADEFTKQHLDLPNLAIIILLIVSIIMGLIGDVAIYMALG